MHTHSVSPHNRKGLWIVLVLSFLYMIAEILGGIWSQSLALLADAGHMATDVAAIGLGIFASWMAQKPATADKTYGYYRVEILAATVNGAALFAISIWIFFEAWSRYQNPVPIRGELMTAVAIGGLFINLIALKVTHQGSKHSLNVRAVWLHVLSDALGSLSAIIAGLLVWKYNWLIADPIISVVIGLLIMVSASRLLGECVNVLLEGVPKGLDVGDIREGLLQFPGTEEVHDLHVWTLTSGVIALSVHIRVSQDTDHGEALEGLTKYLKESFGIQHVTIQLEPKNFTHPQLTRCHD